MHFAWNANREADPLVEEEVASSLPVFPQTFYLKYLLRLRYIPKFEVIVLLKFLCASLSSYIVQFFNIKRNNIQKNDNVQATSFGGCCRSFGSDILSTLYCCWWCISCSSLRADIFCGFIKVSNISGTSLIILSYWSCKYPVLNYLTWRVWSKNFAEGKKTLSFCCIPLQQREQFK